ncbi:lytic transglycosylase domain-containing protein [Alteriqipengyuania flavescens]|uniref:lytic transglycosylase domain-containing protein n=1 Tax=Alteriqipengyuania flavescens TaxID=3053610 RepID=UPI0025B379B1|nr:lytic transglycosylase domain-containing protein [Alteriqipengyuania flavescens]WJY17833.1 lytic transglycosylase domain-containing protein [Alteriqipengyuania flavescens]WJY23774.1 lytic transglycosylase domain-containing protein [Alteriqipengyuania flavescens]
MIRTRRLMAIAGSAMLVLGSPAHADVIEIGAGGARWVAGGAGDVSGIMTIAPASAAPGAIPTAEVPADIRVPTVAIADLSIAPGVVPAVYAAHVADLADRYDLSPALIEALVWQESRWNQVAISPVGARGLGQLMPGTARELGVNPDDPFANLEGAARYLRIQLNTFGDLELALAAYNAGPARVRRAGGIPRIRETQNYVAAIMGRLSNYSRSE